jgi:hypothetical protein
MNIINCIYFQNNCQASKPGAQPRHPQALRPSLLRKLVIRRYNGTAVMTIKELVNIANIEALF